MLSVDAFVTPAAGVRRNHQVEYVGKASPDPLVIDYDLIRTAPMDLNVAGIGDLLSIHTASFDWVLAEQRGKSEYPFSQQDVDAARAILNEVMSNASDIRNCTDDGLQAIVDGYMRINTICLPAGHYRVEEGSEHYLFYELEERLRAPLFMDTLPTRAVVIEGHFRRITQQLCQNLNRTPLAAVPVAQQHAMGRERVAARVCGKLLPHRILVPIQGLFDGQEPRNTGDFLPGPTLRV